MNAERLVREAVLTPYPGQDRFDPDFEVLIRCEECQGVASVPRRFVSAAMREHRESSCPRRRTRADEPNVTRVFYPRT